jgi:hypothetical protein
MCSRSCFTQDQSSTCTPPRFRPTVLCSFRASSSASRRLDLCSSPQYVLCALNPLTTLPGADAEDQSLAKWKASLGISAGPTASDPSDPRRCIIQSLTLEVKGRSNIVIDLTAPGSLEKLKSKPFTIKEGAEFNMKAVFKVQHDVLSGLKYVQSVKRNRIQVAKDEEMLVGSKLYVRPP